jgi:hypothetical protein
VEQNIKPRMTSSHIQQQINELDGELGLNCANAALCTLKEAFEEGLRLDLDTIDNQKAFIDDLGVMAAEILYFRRRMKEAIDNDGFIPSPNVRADDIPEFKTILKL